MSAGFTQYLAGAVTLEDRASEVLRRGRDEAAAMLMSYGLPHPWLWFGPSDLAERQLAVLRAMAA